jgi:cyanophycinase
MNALTPRVPLTHTPDPPARRGPSRRSALVRLAITLAAAAAGAQAGCAAHPDQSDPVQRELIIIGGGLSARNEPVREGLRRAVASAIQRRSAPDAGARAAGPLAVVVPTASADAPAALERTGRMLAEWLPDARVEGLPFTEQTAPALDEDRAPALYASADLLYFTGGDQSRIIRAFRRPAPSGAQPPWTAPPDDTPSYLATLRAGVIAGTSAGAAMMSDPMITGGTSRGSVEAWFGLRQRPAPADDPDVDEDNRAGRPVSLGRGMGYLPVVLTDQHFFARGRLGRLVVALHQAGRRFGIGIADDRAVRVEVRGSSLVFTALGDRAALFIDRGDDAVVPDARAASDPARLGPVRVWLLSDADRLVLAGERVSLHPAGTRRQRWAPRAEASGLLAGNPWGSGRAVEALRMMAVAGGGEVVVGASDGVRLRFYGDERTTLIAQPDRPDYLGVDGALVEILAPSPR